MKKMHIKFVFFIVFSALSSPVNPLFYWENRLFSGIIETSEAGGKGSGRQFQRYQAP